MIKLNDLLQKLDQCGYRVKFTESIEDAKDITDLINKIRNAVCHMDSGEHLWDKKRKIKFSFCVAYGKGALMSMGEKKITSDYEDDICFFFGELKIYLKRHIIKSVEEATKQLDTLYKE